MDRLVAELALKIVAAGGLPSLFQLLPHSPTETIRKIATRALDCVRNQVAENWSELEAVA